MSFKLPDVDQPLEPVFTAFGYAAFWAYMWEAELVALSLTLKRIKNPSITKIDLEQYDALLRKERTAGTLVKGDISELLFGEVGFKDFFNKITGSRNRLIHRLYEEQLPNLNSESGRQLAVKEIELITTELKAGSFFVREIYMQLARSKFQDVDGILNSAVERSRRLWSD